jgi:hypothetical protein
LLVQLEIEIPLWHAWAKSKRSESESGIGKIVIKGTDQKWGWRSSAEPGWMLNTMTRNVDLS